MQHAAKTGTLHRDISLGNLMVSIFGEGILNDWDHAIYTTNDIARGNRTVRILPLVASFIH